MNKQTNTKIRVKLESFNHELLELSCQKILSLLNQTTANSISLLPLPTNKRIYCVLRSPHVNKDSREHFEIRIHKRILEISYDNNISADIFDLLSKVDLPAGVFYCLYIS
jgi:small subunit ribosomal protein S10